MRRLPLIPLVLALAALAAWSAIAPAPAAANGCSLRLAQGASGTAEDPILIADRAALTTLATSSSCFESAYVYRQTADIDLSGAAWTPIAVGGAFRGTYDGGGHRITGLEVSVSGTHDGAGLFDQVQGGAVRDLVIVGPRVVASGQFGAAGALAAVVRLALVERVRVEGGSVQGAYRSGGLVGELCYASLSRGASSAAITGVYGAGGLVGLASSTCPLSAGGVDASIAPAAGAITDSHATGAVTGESAVGGLVGELSGATIERSFATGAVAASNSGAGGIVGRAFGQVDFAVPAEDDPNALVDVYATGAVSAPQGGVGGLIGLTESGLVITRSYATGRVTGSPDAGGLVGGELIGCAGIGIAICSADVGTAQAAPATSFWDSATTGQSTSHGGYGTARSTAEMQSLATYTAAGWPITRGFSSAAETTWGICPSANGGYPFLQNRYTASTPPCAGGSSARSRGSRRPRGCASPRTPAPTSTSTSRAPSARARGARRRAPARSRTTRAAWSPPTRPPGPSRAASSCGPATSTSPSRSTCARPWSWCSSTTASSRSRATASTRS